MAAQDSTGLCMFAQSGGIDAVCDAVGFLTGNRFEGQDWQALGDSILRTEIAFNQAAGLDATDDRLPPMFHNEPLGPMHDTVPYPEDDLHGMFKPERTLIKKEK